MPDSDSGDVTFVPRYLEGQSAVTIQRVSCGDFFTACLTGLTRLPAITSLLLHRYKYILTNIIVYYAKWLHRKKNTIIYTKYKNTFTKQNIKTDYKLKLQFILY